MTWRPAEPPCMQPPAVPPFKVNPALKHAPTRRLTGLTLPPTRMILVSGMRAQPPPDKMIIDSARRSSLNFTAKTRSDCQRCITGASMQHTARAAEGSPESCVHASYMREAGCPAAASSVGITVASWHSPRQQLAARGHSRTHFLPERSRTLLMTGVWSS